MKKNWINWKRTPCGSLSEIICPLILIGMLVSLKGLFVTEMISASVLYENASLQTPINIKKGDKSIEDNLRELAQFNAPLMQFAGKGKEFEPKDNCDRSYDGGNPCREWKDEGLSQTLLGMTYDHCYESDRNGVLDSKWVGVIHNGNKVGQQFEEEIKKLSEYQTKAYDQKVRKLVMENLDFDFKNIANLDKESQAKLQSLGRKPISFEIKNFISKQEMYDFIALPDYRSPTVAGLCFAVLIDEVKNKNGYNVEIFFNDKQDEARFQGMPDQVIAAYDEFIANPDLQNFKFYTNKGYSKLHNMIANLILREKFPDEKDNHLATISNLIIPNRGEDYEQNDFARILPLLSFFLFLIFIVPLYRITYRVVAEKETKARESMKMMGLTDSSYWLSWVSYYALVVTMISLICVIMLGSLLRTSGLVIFIIIWIYGMSLFGYALIMQAIFNKARTAGGFATTVYFVTSFFDQVVNKPFHTYSEKTAASLLSPVALNRIIYVMSVAEGHEGLNFTNINQEYQNYVVSHGIIIMIVSGILTSLIGLYLDNVIQQDYGTAKRWNYFLQAQFWGCKKAQKHNLVNNKATQEDENDMEDYYMEKRNYQPVVNPELLAQEQGQQILKVSGLKKQFGDFKAVNGINLKMYKGQIFALLGHNGAGKTTTISMLTGLITPSEGKASVYDKDLFNQMDDVRQFMGVCPQHDVLFDLLTPKEHLEVFCDFKGVAKEGKMEEIEKIMTDIDLQPVKNMRAGQLSGGNKRKLSIAIALVGGSKFILLDEPTAGIDLSGRRKLWDMLKKYKDNRIIILTTHYMDEADILGDRIGIMAQGQIVTLGRSLFLKNRFGVGYRLSMVKNSKEANKKVGVYLEEKLGASVQLMSEVSSEITYQIPKGLSERFKNFFHDFDKDLDGLGILSYGISVTTLEEVFLSVGHSVAENDKKGKGNSPETIAEINEKEELEDYTIAENPTSLSFGSIFEQFWAVIKRRMQVYRKNNALLQEIFVPVFLVMVGLAFSKVEFFATAPVRPLVPSAYPLKQDILFNNQLLRTFDNGDIQPSRIMMSLPNQEESFNIIKYENQKEKDQNNFDDTQMKAFDNAVFNNAKQDIPYQYGSYFIIEANNDTKSFKTATFINTTSKDASAYFSQYLYQAILRQATGNPDFVFNVSTTAFPLSQRLLSRDSSGDALFISIISGIGFALIPATVIGNIVMEKERGLKHIAVVSGMNLFSYWGANFVFDVIKSVIPCALSIACLFIFEMGYTDCWTTILMYPIGMVPFAYVLSFLFNEEGSAQTFMLFGNVAAGSIMPMVIFVLKLIPDTIQDGDMAGKLMKVIPNYTISNSISYDASKQVFNQSRSIVILSNPDVARSTLEPYELNNIGGDLLALGLHCVIGLTLIIIVESFPGCIAKTRKPKVNQEERQGVIDLDEDVTAEEERVSKIEPKDCLIKVDGLKKVYKQGYGKSTVAIEKTSFAIDKGECFALLGVNGAGKTTTFKSLTREVIPTKGVLTVMGYDIQSQFNQARKYIGYCPQYDTIYDLLTVEEHIQYQMVLKSIPSKYRKSMLNRILQNMNLVEYRSKNAGTLSGGNKRKLSVAMSLIGSPPVILLDEPSAGMDPEARRFMWGVVAKVSQEKKSSGVVISTHSMEEAEALSTKMGIQVKGGMFKCFGSSQHIKNKYATGYEIEAKFKTMSDSELKKLKSKLSINKADERMNLDDFIDVLKKNDVDDFLIGQITQDGYGSDLVAQNLEYQSIDVNQALQWLHTECYGLSFLKFLSREFNQVEILEHVSDFFKVRVPKGTKTIGFTFGTIEDEKSNLRISEYSVSQTTLEQIFQSFAKVTIQGPADKTVLKSITGLEKSAVKLMRTRAGHDDDEQNLKETVWIENFTQTLNEAEERDISNEGGASDRQLLKSARESAK